MGKVTITEAFAKYGTKLVNARWAVSAIAPDGALVFSAWNHLFGKAERGVLPYEDELSRWDTNVAGANLLREHLALAYAEQRPVRLIVATMTEEHQGTGGAQDVDKDFYVRSELTGLVTAFDGNRFRIEYRKASGNPATARPRS